MKILYIVLHASSFFVNANILLTRGGQFRYRFSSQPATFGSKFEDGLSYLAFIQIPAKIIGDDDPYLCGGPDYELDEYDQDQDEFSFVKDLGGNLQKVQKQEQIIVEDTTSATISRTTRSSFWPTLFPRIPKRTSKQQRQQTFNNPQLPPKRILERQEQETAPKTKSTIPIALIVPQGKCSFEQKARTAMSTQLKPPNNVVQFLIVYGYLDDYNNCTSIPPQQQISPYYYYSPDQDLRKNESLRVMNACNSSTEDISLGMLYISRSSGEKIVEEILLSESNKEKKNEQEDGPRITMDSSTNIYYDAQNPGYLSFILLIGGLVFVICCNINTSVYLQLRNNSESLYQSQGLVDQVAVEEDGDGLLNGNQGNLNHLQVNAENVRRDVQDNRLLTTSEVLEFLPEVLVKMDCCDRRIHTKEKIVKRTQQVKIIPSTDSSSSSSGSNNTRNGIRNVISINDPNLLYNTTSCSICIEEFEDGDRLKVLPCGHLYHTICILPWLTERKNCCPLCKAPILPKKEDNAGTEDQEFTVDGLLRRIGNRRRGRNRSERESYRQLLLSVVSVLFHQQDDNHSLNHTNSTSNIAEM